MTAQTYIYRLLGCGLIAWTLASCNQYLDIQPKGIVIPSTTEDYELLLNYNQIQKGSAIDPIYMTDDALLPDSEPLESGFDYHTVWEQRFYTFDPITYGEGREDALYQENYNRIFTYNAIISHVLDSEGDSQERKRRVRAEALVGRAFDMLDLVNAYAPAYDATTARTDLAVPIRTDLDISSTQVVRASVQEVYDQIIKDLEEAIPDLPVKPIPNAFRASKAAGHGLLARTYLYMGEWQKALDNALKVLESNRELLNLEAYDVVNPNGAIGRINVPDRIESKENIYIKLLPYVFGLSSSVYMSPDLEAHYDQERDHRYRLYATKAIYNVVLEHPYWRPYLYENVGISTPEMYLVAAECYARLGNSAEALALIGTLREHRIAQHQGLVSSSSEETLRLVLEERRRELALRGLFRFFDLKRLNRDPRFAKTITHTVRGKEYTLPAGDARYILPIPPVVLRFNPLMPDNKRD